jgi:hypothetical protein
MYFNFSHPIFTFIYSKQFMKSSAVKNDEMYKFSAYGTIFSSNL